MGGSNRDSAGIEADQPGSAARARLPRPVRSFSRPLLALCVAVGGLLLLSSPALAGTELHHTFGSSFKGEAQCSFTQPGAMAVNNATHEVFVFDRATNSVSRFSSTGACLTNFKVGEKEKGVAVSEGLAVDNSNGPFAGDVYVFESGERTVYRFTPTGEKVGPGIKTFQKEGEAEAHEFKALHGLAVDEAGTLWVYHGKEGAAGSGFQSVIDSFTNGEATGFASAVPLESECPPRTGFAVAANAEFFYVARARENSKEKCEQQTVMVKLTPSGGLAAEPAVAQLGAANTTGAAVDRSTGEIYADNETSVAAFTSAGTFTESFGGGEGASALREATGIAVDPSTHDVYVADAHEGKVEIFIPAPPELPPIPEPALADGRAWEMVTPQNKLGAAIFPITITSGLVQASEAGDAITYSTSAPIVTNPPANRSPEPVPNLSRRGSQGWVTQDLATPRNQVPIGYKSGIGGSEYRFFSSDLSAGLLQPDLGLSVPEEERLSSDATETTLYRRTTTGSPGSCEPVPSSCYEALVTAANNTSEPQSKFGGKLEFVSASADGRHAVFLSDVPLTPGAGEKSFYEWEPGQRLQLINVLPISEKGTEAEAASIGVGEAGTNEGDVRHAISDNGSRVFWSDEPEGEEKNRLYVRDVVRGETLRIDKAQGVPQPRASTAVFQTASADGSKVFFTDRSRLTPNASSEGEEPDGEGDLYECDIVPVEGKLACNLTDLTPKLAKNGPASVQGVALGASELGTSIYFVANGVLAAGASQGHCTSTSQEGTPAGATCNLYVAQSSGGKWESPKFIAALTGEDVPVWGSNQSHSVALISSRVSPNGRFLAFMSSRSLTGYNNVDKNEPKARDEEVFLYDANTNRIVCASCNPSGEPPAGVLDTEKSGEGTGLLVDRPGTWIPNAERHTDPWLAANIPTWTALKAQIAIYQSRYLSDSGRLFFNSSDTLVPADKNHKMDVYEYEPSGEGTCGSEHGCVSLISSGAETATHESAFLDASVSGDHVFFLTAERLVTQDNDTGFDIYDAKICTSSSPCLGAPTPPPPACQGEGCKAPTSSQSALPSAPPSMLPGAGNGGVLGVTVINKPKPTPKPETRAQKLAKALKACKKLKKKQKRITCEKQAKKKYGPAKKTAKKKGKK
ncbi:MAG: hypothetical protein QOI89_433 [Solirubrobacteraceae bacterium]|jgi:DNA-binding beta-propeller fold protein YncE|nr:hypothetical protein [Solirubrobacteraceae bacterium]